LREQFHAVKESVEIECSGVLVPALNWRLFSFGLGEGPR
jgi:hypothetical protein